MSADNRHRSRSAADTPTWVVDLLLRLEDAWNKGQNPAVEAFLPPDAAQRRPAVVPLLCCDLERRVRAGQAVRVEDYLQRFPELAEDAAGLGELVAVEYELVGQRPGVSLVDYLRRFPQCQAHLRNRFPREAGTIDITAGNEQGTRPPGDAAAPALPPLRYKPVQFHAKGNLGEVLVAQDDELNRSVALKRIQEQHADNAESRRRFLREAEITGRLEHPGVVPVYGLGQDGDGRPCYAMRFIQGESLKEAIERFHAAEKPGRDPGERRLALRQLLGSFVAVCKTMAYAHSRGVLHRDLKPANIMLGKYGETLVVDWGLARSFQRDDTARSLGEESLQPGLAGGAGETQMGQMMGTPAFCSPEQAGGKWDVVGPSSDIFSLGAVLYNLLTNALPYEASSVLEIIEQVNKGEVIPPRQRKKDIQRALEAICLKAMAHKRADRYGTALELAADIEDWLADEPVAAHRESVAERLGRIGRRHRSAVVAGGAILFAGAALAAALFLAHAREKEKTLREIADEAKEAVEEQSSYLRVANGVTLLDQGEAFGALLWFAKALAEEKRGPEYEKAHRWRLGAVLAQCPRLCHVWRHDGPVYYAEFSPDGRHVVTASADHTARVWDAGSGLPVTAPMKHDGDVWHASFSPNGRRLVTASGEFRKPGEARVWDVASGQPVTPPIRHKGMVCHASFSRDGGRVITSNGITSIYNEMAP
jgi:serine/threonine protein kinase